MARNIESRLKALKARRSGSDRISRIATASQISVLADSLLTEAYQKRSSKPYTQYALGSMQEVKPDYTRVSIETAERVAKQIVEALASEGFDLACELQGSVPCNLHIRGVSDVDLLILDTAFYTYDSTGQAARAGWYNSPINYTPVSALLKLRKRIEEVLPLKFPAADVDTKGRKAVAISGGSLARPVDVVPSHWHNTADYQRTYLKEDRGVRILDKIALTTIGNMPFKHIKQITDQDIAALRSLKKAIRLCKHVKNDAIDEGKSIPFSSFDLAATMYHANIPALRVGAGYELAILAETQRHLDALTCNPSSARILMVPDGSRRIFDTDEKLDGLRALSIEIDDLSREVAKEHSVLLEMFGQPSLSDSRSTLEKAYIADIAA